MKEWGERRIPGTQGPRTLERDCRIVKRFNMIPGGVEHYLRTVTLGMYVWLIAKTWAHRRSGFFSSYREIAKQRDVSEYTVRSLIAELRACNLVDTVPDQGRHGTFFIVRVPQDCEILLPDGVENDKRPPLERVSMKKRATDGVSAGSECETDNAPTERECDVHNPSCDAENASCDARIATCDTDNAPFDQIIQTPSSNSTTNTPSNNPPAGPPPRRYNGTVFMDGRPPRRRREWSGWEEVRDSLTEAGCTELYGTRGVFDGKEERPTVFYIEGVRNETST